MTVEELRNDIAHMDRVELVAFGRLHRPVSRIAC